MNKNAGLKYCTLVWLAILIFSGLHCFAQDTIVKKDGRQILGKVLEVSVTEVKYKKAEIPDGPIYVEDKSTIMKIKYHGGFVDLFPESTTRKSAGAKAEGNDDYAKPEDRYPLLTKLPGGRYLYGTTMIKEAQAYDILLRLNNVEISKEIEAAKLSKGLRYIGFAAIPLMAGAGIYGIVRTLGNNYTRKDDDIAIGIVAGAGVCFGASIYFNINYRYKTAKAIRAYQINYTSKN